jgi:GxxExxY protein
MKYSKKELNLLVYKVIGAAIVVHKYMGPGLLEKVYQKCFEKELEIRGIQFKSEFNVPVEYKGVLVQTELRCDLLIEDILVIELKSVDKILPIHEAQILTYMKLLHIPKGIIINFNVSNLYHEGTKSMVNDIFMNLLD